MYGLDDEQKTAKSIIGELEKGECGMRDEGYEVKGHGEVEVEEVWAVKCVGKVEDWEVLGKIKLVEL